MTAKDAVEILQEEHDWAQLLSYVNAAIKTAVKALEKQIPKKPNGEYCSCCKRHLRKPKISVGYTGKVKKRNGDAYCPSCGQALDWSENNQK